MFFSFPLLYPRLISAFIPQSLLPRPLQTTKTSTKRLLPRPPVAIIFLTLMFAAVYYNTFAHPFTLADNRHYVFYVFRWFLLRHPLARYVAVPVYFLCGWCVITALGTSGPPPTGPSKQPKTARPPKPNPSNAHDGNKVSFVLIWLASTSLALITVPLVEPRYFIVPWVLWRLHLPATTSPLEEWLRRGTMLSWPKYHQLDIHRLGLETVWFAMINLVTGYVFLYRGFEWPQEPGTVQRFMW